MRKFHAYLFGHPFQLITNHQPLLTLLSEHKPTSPQSSARIRRWSLLLASYEYNIVFRRTHAHGNADALSQLPLPTQEMESSTPPEIVLLVEHMAESPVAEQQIWKWTLRDPVLSAVLEHILTGWPNQSRPELKPFFTKCNELTVLNNCILWGSHVVIPFKWRKPVLTELHVGHPGVTRMKSLAPKFVWWPGIN